MGPDSGPIPDVWPIGLDANITQFGGGIACVDLTTGFLKPVVAPTVAIPSLNQRVCVGKAEPLNGLGQNNPGAAGAISVPVRQGVHKWSNSAGVDAINPQFVGQLCYAVDDQTVGATPGNLGRAPAGIIARVDSDGVWVGMGLTL